MSRIQTITLQNIKQKGAKAIPDDHVVYLIVNSKMKSAIVPFEEYEAIMEIMEDLEDAKAIEAAHKEPTVSWEEAFKFAKKRA